MAGDTIRLTYTRSRGIAEPIRLALVASGIEYTDIYLQTREAFVQLIEGGKLMYKQLPLLEIDGLNLTGSEAVLRYVCSKGNLEGKTNAEKAKIDMLSMGAKDMVLKNIIFAHFDELLVSKEKAEEDFAIAIKDCRNKYLPVFEKALSESKSGFFVGDSMTMADIMLFDALTYIKDIPQLKAIGLIDEYPLCKAFINHFSNQPRIKDYLASERRFPIINMEQVKNICQVMGWIVP